MSQQKFDGLLEAIRTRKEKVYAHLMQKKYADLFEPEHIRSAVYSYIKGGGKSLRPVVLLLSCGAVGGDEEVAIPAAAAVEVFHTWTLVHDDIIDRDEKRRGVPTVHTQYAEIARREMGHSEAEAAHYGLTIALLTGDLQQAWQIFLMAEAAQERGVDALLVLNLLTYLTARLAPTLIAGETLDVQYSKRSVDQISEADILDMLWKKTGALYEFAGRAGAAIGLGDVTLEDPLVVNIARFCSQCGTAFQLQDDILGIVGDERRLGKPVGSDIREGKSTLITLKAFQNATPEQRAALRRILGNPQASEQEILTAANLLRDLGGIEYTQKLARKYVEEAIPLLDPLAPSHYKDLLIQWAEYLVERKI
ncbi:MAG: polyprenyl synthetase family protein [Chloroflexi bacterium]|nr:MAG: polyprenyl synthetase family protein [Chloroflexota bacterium]